MSHDRELSRREFLKLSGLATAGILSPEIKLPCVFFNHGDPKSNKVAITVDDGWFPDIVERMVKKSLDLGLSISAFPVGAVIQQSFSLWQDVKSCGIEIYNHTQNHRDLGNLDEKGIVRQLEGWEKTYKEVFGEEYQNKIVRPPFGNGIGKELFDTADKLGYRGIAGWTIGSKGYSSRYTPEEVWNQIRDKIKSGAIILLHFAQNDLEILPRIAEHLAKNGLEAVPLSKLPGTPCFEPVDFSKIRHNYSNASK